MSYSRANYLPLFQMQVKYSLFALSLTHSPKESHFSSELLPLHANQLRFFFFFFNGRWPKFAPANAKSR